MPYREDAFVPGCIYHIYNRGVNRMSIFANPGNYVYLLRKVKSLLAELPVTMLAYCLMPNHYHFVLRQDEATTFPKAASFREGKDGGLSTFMQRLFITYTQAFNKQQERTGPLFQGRFRHIRVDRDEYVMHLCRYVHLNPVVAGLVSRPAAWPYSNYLEWIEAREGKLVDRAFVQEFFPTPESYIAFVQGHIAPEKAKELQPYLLDDDD